MSSPDSPVVLADETTSRQKITMRKVIFNVPPEEFLDTVRGSDAYREESEHTGLYSVRLGAPSVAGSFQVYATDQTEFSDSTYGLDEFIRGDSSDESSETENTVVVVHPYGGRGALSDRIEREWEAEDRELIEWLIEQAERTSGDFITGFQPD